MPATPARSAPGFTATIAASPQLEVDLTYTNMDIDEDGLMLLEGDIRLSASGRDETVHVQGHAAC